VPVPREGKLVGVAKHSPEAEWLLDLAPAAFAGPATGERRHEWEATALVPNAKRDGLRAA